MAHTFSEELGQAHQLPIAVTREPPSGKLACTDVVSPEKCRLGAWEEKEEDQGLAHGNQLSRLIGGNVDGIISARDGPVHGERNECGGKVSGDHHTPSRQGGTSAIRE